MSVVGVEVAVTRIRSIQVLTVTDFDEYLTPTLIFLKIIESSIKFENS
jgi:hypothetical protein